MKNRGRLSVLIIVMVILIAMIYGLANANISALPEPGWLETSVATRARDWLVAREAKSVPQSVVQDNAASISKGKALYGMDCASCHGRKGITPSPIGQAMYPRVPRLGSPMVQSLSDRELDWVIANGIRLSGMPGFAKIDTKREVWQLVYYVRSVGKASK
ncbi:MAG TPA: cytochrome c [Candidatus Dormibacteraeota bacterium]|nr:cytochrome c [Candidatus Dormibacteraeota bacterium]